VPIVLQKSFCVTEDNFFGLYPRLPLYPMNRHRCHPTACLKGACQEETWRARLDCERVATVEVLCDVANAQTVTNASS
jgi:hypothetical protein